MREKIRLILEIIILFVLSTISYFYLLGPIVDRYSTVLYNNDHIDLFGVLLLIFIFSIAACIQNAATLKKINNEGWLYKIIIFFLDLLVMPLSMLLVVLYNNYNAIGLTNLSTVFTPLMFIFVHAGLPGRNKDNIALLQLINKRRSFTRPPFVLKSP